MAVPNKEGTKMSKKETYEIVERIIKQLSKFKKEAIKDAESVEGLSPSLAEFYNGKIAAYISAKYLVETAFEKGENEED